MMARSFVAAKIILYRRFENIEMPTQSSMNAIPDGFGVLKALRSETETKDLPVRVTSALGTTKGGT